MEHDVMERLRAARPRVDDDAFDPELLARVREQPIEARARRAVPRAVAIPVAAGVTLTVAGAVMLAGGPGDVGGPSSASAITQALHWLDPGADQILHARSVETQGGRTTTREVWQSSDDPADQRLRIEDASTYELSGDAFYDPSTDTIYDGPSGPAAKGAGGAPERKAAAGGATVGKSRVPVPANKGRDPALPSGDPIVEKVRILLSEGHMRVTGLEDHNGTQAWAISLKPDAGRPAWTIWVDADNGKPLELRDPGRDAEEAPQTIRWTSYEVLPEAGADQLLTLTGAHPSARVVHDPAAVDAARQRLQVAG
ncbi:hypothetical protein OM076_02375 [Solirubrobacter ginsenosidimutans]|uniref:MucB/RseB N-terminal domain-containing protein n=1 Tax=Solirubrobacter ginsenosidimutans TaxID=490573 RepID=A0A9X3MSZ9_9ACTN|nr:hypothetical protein [Solirubrobacter ginsenosidimutans]MDA0159098.1 hypothetical protein [Solirubrobacter ginsenosidimutans]